MSKRLVQAVARSLGLTRFESKKVAYGIVDGFLAQAYYVREKKPFGLGVLFRHAGTGKEQAIRDAFFSGGHLYSAADDVAIGGATAAVTFRYHSFVGMPSAEAVLREVNALRSALKAESAPEPARCRLCATVVADEPVLLQGIVDRLCPSCIERLEMETRAAEAEYMARSLNLPLGFVAAVAAGCAGALLSAGGLVLAHDTFLKFILGLTDSMFWGVAGVTGAMVGHAAVRGAGRAGRAVQAIAAFVTLVSVLAGLLGYLAYEADVKAVAGGAAWDHAVAHSIDLLMTGKDGPFEPLVAGLFGAWAAIKKTQPPSFRTVASHKKAERAYAG